MTLTEDDRCDRLALVDDNRPTPGELAREDRWKVVDGQYETWAEADEEMGR